jgi:hypothetical protein
LLGRYIHEICALADLESRSTPDLKVLDVELRLNNPAWPSCATGACPEHERVMADERLVIWPTIRPVFIVLAVLTSDLIQDAAADLRRSGFKRTNAVDLRIRDRRWRWVPCRHNKHLNGLGVRADFVLVPDRYKEDV